MKIPDFVLHILAQKAYDAYNEYFESIFGLKTEKDFEEISSETMDAWKCVVRTIIEDYPQIDSYDYGDMEDGERVVGR